MISNLLRGWTSKFLDSMACFIARTGMPPNLLTAMGFVLNVVVAYVLAQGHMQAGGLLVIVAGLFDALDGALARSAGRTSRFGAFLDSTLDRLSEAAIYFGLLAFYTQRGARWEGLLIYAAVIGSLMVSYARARAEGLGIECEVGLFTRFERVAVLALGLLSQRMLIALWALAILANFTALQRIYHVWRVTRSEGGGKD